MTEKNHYESGAIHNDHHKEINIGNVSEKALADIIGRFLKDDAEETTYEELTEEECAPSPERNEKPVQEEPTFVRRVKDIVHKAATKNGIIIGKSPKGHAERYRFYIDDAAFCKAVDELERTQSTKLQEFLGGNLQNVQVTKVCLFIGAVVRKNIINDEKLQLKDIAFAFSDYYGNEHTVVSKLSQTRLSADEQLLINTFEGLLRRFKSE